MEEFAQTRDADDLFDDEIVPIETQTIDFDHEHVYNSSSNDHPEHQQHTPLSPPHPPQDHHFPQREQRSLRRGHGRGGRTIRGGERRSRGSLALPKRNQSQSRSPSRRRPRAEADSAVGKETRAEAIRDSVKEKEGGDAPSDWNSNKSPAPTTVSHTADAGEAGADPSTPAAGEERPAAAPKAADDKSRHVHTVRGDRSGTGCVRKVCLSPTKPTTKCHSHLQHIFDHTLTPSQPKLSEDELTTRIAAAKTKAAARSAAYARAEADEARFHERERIAEQVRAEREEQERAAEQKREQEREQEREREKREREQERQRVAADEERRRRRAEDEARHRAKMNRDREQNRQLKLAAQTWREWDAVKAEKDDHDGDANAYSINGGASDGSENSNWTGSWGRRRGGRRGGRGRRGHKGVDAYTDADSATGVGADDANPGSSNTSPPAVTAKSESPRSTNKPKKAEAGMEGEAEAEDREDKGGKGESGPDFSSVLAATEGSWAEEVEGSRG